MVKTISNIPGQGHTSKGLQALMTPLLYQHMELSSVQLTKTFMRTIESSHPGRPFVRVLSVQSLEEAQVVVL